MKSQSAMEYLMTYGWAILIIAVVLGAIYSLGLFNGISLAPRAQPGSCQVIRPNGAVTTAYISLAGACTNELPQYVAQFNGAGQIVTGSTGLPSGNGQRSVFAWVYYNGNSALQYTIFAYGNKVANQWSTLYVRLGYASFEAANPYFFTTMNVPVNSWSFIGYTWDSSNMIIYLNGQSQKSTSLGTLATTITPNNAVIGSTDGNWPGMIANLQVYNTSLDANSVQALYQEGIGGAPINLQNLVAWWPLNGNANDYSGDINNGQPTGITYTNQWISGYTVP